MLSSLVIKSTITTIPSSALVHHKLCDTSISKQVNSQSILYRWIASINNSGYQSSPVFFYYGIRISSSHVSLSSVVEAGSLLINLQLIYGSTWAVDHMMISYQRRRHRMSRSIEGFSRFSRLTRLGFARHSLTCSAINNGGPRLCGN